MAIKAEGIRSSAYMQAFNRANKKGGASARRNCVAVPEVKMPKLKIKPPTMELERRAVHRLKVFIATRRTVALISAICIAFFLIAGLIENSQYKSAVEVQFDGKTIGVVSSEEEFEKYFTEAKDELSQFLEGNEVYVEQKPILIGRRVKENAFSAPSEIKKNIKSMVDVSIAAYAIIVDGKQMGLVKDETTANVILQEIRKPFLVDDPDIKVGFANNVDIEKKYVQVGAIQQKEEVFNALSQLKEEVKQYTIKENDTLWGIAQLYKIPVEEIMRINPGVGENIQPGQQINLTVPEPILGIETRETVVYNEDIPFEVKEIEDANLYQGRRTVIDKGFNGEQKVEAEIVKVNGIETGKEVMKTYVLSQPKIQTEKVGTKPVPPKYGTGVFRRPTYGVLTSRFGTRGREWHTGIDLAGNIGDPIYASDGGKVIFAGRQGNYGLLVKISHDNEYVTYYGHCSKLLVKEGERVAKGEVIAYVGNTGRSTGPHVHFEVRKDGTPVNPLNYLNR